MVGDERRTVDNVETQQHVGLLRLHGQGTHNDEFKKDEYVEIHTRADFVVVGHTGEMYHGDEGEEGDVGHCHDLRQGKRGIIGLLELEGFYIGGELGLHIVKPDTHAKQQPIGQQQTEEEGEEGTSREGPQRNGQTEQKDGGKEQHGRIDQTAEADTKGGMKDVTRGTRLAIGGEKGEIGGHKAEHGNHVDRPRVEKRGGGHQNHEGGAHHTGTDAQKRGAVVELCKQIGDDDHNAKAFPRRDIVISGSEPQKTANDDGCRQGVNALGDSCPEISFSHILMGDVVLRGRGRIGWLEAY